MIKMIATDLDGTLLNSAGGISERNAAAIERAKELGVRVCIASGRIHATCKLFHDDLRLDTPVIAVNGAWVQLGEEVLEHHVIPAEHVGAGIEIAKMYAIPPMVVCRDRMLYFAENREYLKPVLGFYEEYSFFEAIPTLEEMLERVKAFGVERLSFICFEARELAELRAELGDVFQERLEISSSWASNLELMKAGVSKALGVKRVAELYGVERGEIMALGDHDNDVSMIEYAGVSVAMGNACEALKSRAGHMTDDNDADGFAKAVERFVL